MLTLILPNIFDAEHPARKKAISILEYLSEKLGQPDIFYGELWYALEDALTEIIVKEVKMPKSKIGQLQNGCPDPCYTCSRTDTNYCKKCIDYNMAKERKG